MQPRNTARLGLTIALALAFGLLLSFTVATASPAPGKLPLALRAPVDPTLKMNQRFLSAGPLGTPMVELFLQGNIDPEMLRARGIEVNTVAGGFATARCPLGLVGELVSLPGITRMTIADRAKPNLDASTADIGLPLIRTVTPPNFTGETGEGVIIGDVDSGIDLANPDFKNEDGTTRLVALWDQTVVGTPPPGFTYGAYYTPAQINAGTALEDDPDGHGTLVAGILAGDGSSTGNGQPAFTYVGVAPKADICFVKTDYSTTRIVDGVNFIFQRAAALGKRAVVNLSLGTQNGPHDGTNPFDTMVNALTGPGKIVVASAGNAETDGIHGQLTLSAAPQNMTLSVPLYTKNAGAGNDYLVFSGWYEGGDQMSLTITTPRGAVIGPVPAFTDLTDQNTIDGYINILNGTTATPNGDNEIYIEIFDGFVTRYPREGIWTFQFTPTGITAGGKIDMYLFANGLGDGLYQVSWVQGLAVGGVIGSPAAGDSVIAVAAHTTKPCWTSIDGNGYCFNPLPTLNDIASFSSGGPRRDGVMKPDISAPGFGVAAALSSSKLPAADPPFVVPDGVHVLEAGTSVSAPHVTGTVALLLTHPEWANASPSQIKARLQQTARTDAFTGAVPNFRWGAGKLNAAAALAPLLALTVTHPAKGQYIPPGKQDSIQVNLSAPTTADSVLLDLSINGGASYPIRLGILTGVVPGTPRKVSFFPDLSMVTMQAKVRATTFRTGYTTATAYSDSLFLIQTPTGVETVSGSPAQRFELGPNAPNPFNPVTTIAFGVDRPGRVALRIFNAQGALVRTLVDKQMPAGSFRARWDGKNDAGRAVASGVYLYELSSTGRQITKKMSLLK